ncbi:MAG: lysylphosphatidylglycerol synthase transmembrane domain-containing protein [Planctomycetota bacterium]|nr:lysylphosphatidylglycerol synthase transmembrane domain-containing protein [Planctomycetota bacterium]
MSPPDASSGRPRALSPRALLGVLVAAALLAYALAQVPLRDQLRAGPVEGESLLSAKITLDGGRWRGEALAGQVLELELAPGHPEGWAGLRPGDRLELLQPVAGPGRVQGVEAAWIELRPGLQSLLRSSSPWAFPASLLTLAAATLLIATRWWRLLAAAGCETRWGTAFRITWTSLFFNVALPGLSGGDVARAWIAVRGNPARQEAALASVAADRVFGLWAMTLVAAVAVLLGGEAFETLRLPVLGAAGGISFAWFLYAFGPLGRVLGTGVLSRLPMGQRLARLEATGGGLARAVPTVLVALALSVLNHLACALSIWWVARGLGSQLGFVPVLVVSTVANTLSAIPLAPAGLGVGELLFGSLFELAGGSWAIGVASSLAWRLVLVALGLLGGAGALLPGGRELHRAFRDAAASEDPSGPQA